MSSKKKGLEEKLIAEPLYGKRVIVGFSGGADSVSLLYRLLEIREKKSLTLEAAHVNHCLRAEESERDEAFVRTFCDQWKIPLTVKRVNILKLAQEQHLSVEECGREQRYRFFAALAAEDGIVVTAHTLSDNMETVLFHIIRGTALTGLCGIPAERGNIVRPLLNCTRQDVEDYCKRKKLRFVTDSSNLSVAYTRNKIRLEILPKFYEINPAVDESFFRMLQTLQKDQDCLEQFAEDLWQRAEQGEQIALAQLSDQPEALLCRIGVKILKKYQLPLEHQYVQKVAALIKQGSGRQNIAENIHLKVKDGFLFLDLPVPKVPFFSYAIDPSFKEGISVNILYDEILGKNIQKRTKKISLQIICYKDYADFQKIYKNLLIFALDYDTIIGKLIFRQKIDGDQMKLSQGNGTKTLKKWYQEKKLTPLQRQTALVICDQQGILGAEHIGVDRRAALTEKTVNVLQIIIEKEEKSQE